MPASQLPSIGTAAFKNVGTSPGQVPVVGIDGKLPTLVIPAGTSLPAGGNAYDTLIKDGTNTAVWSNQRANLQAGNTFQADVVQTFKNEAGVTIATIDQTANTITVFNEAGVAQIILNGVSQTITTPVLEASSMGSTPLPANNLTGSINDGRLSANVLLKSNNLAGISNLATARSNLGLGTAATADTGTSSGNVPVLDGTGKLSTTVLPTSILGQVSYQGTWNANTNSPAIPAAASGNKGWYYLVSVAGSTSINSITDWKVGDWIISDGTSWTKVDNTDAVVSVNGQTGAVSGLAVISDGNSWSGTQVLTSGVWDVYSGSSFQFRDTTDFIRGSLSWNLFALNAGTVSSSGTSINTYTVTYNHATGQAQPIKWTITNNTTGTAGSDGFYINMLGTQGGSGTHYFARWQLNGADRFYVDKNGNGYFAGIGTLSIVNCNNIAPANVDLTLNVQYRNFSGTTTAVLACNGTWSNSSGQGTAFHINPTDSTTVSGGLDMLKITRSGTGTGSGSKNFIRCFDGATERVVLDSGGTLTFTGGTFLNSAGIVVGTNGVYAPSFQVLNGGPMKLNWQNAAVAQDHISASQATFTYSTGQFNAFKIAPTYVQSGSAGATDLVINRVETSLGSGSQNFIDAQINSVSVFKVDRLGSMTVVGGAQTASGSAAVASSFSVTDSTTGTGGLHAFTIDYLGSGTGSGTKTIFRARAGSTDVFVVNRTGTTTGSVTVTGTVSASGTITSTNGSIVTTFGFANVSSNFQVGSSEFLTYRGYQITWTDNASNYFGTRDLGITRAAANVLEVNTGTAGVLATVKAATFIGEVSSTGIGYSSAAVLAVDATPVNGGRLPYNATITDVYISTDVSATVSLEVWADGVKISASDPVTITAGTSATKTTFTGWTVNLNKGQLIQYKLIANDNAMTLNVDVIYKHR